MSDEFQVSGRNEAAPFTLKLHRGDGMTLIAMNWKKGTPPGDFVGFAIEYHEPGGERFYALKNRLSFLDTGGETDPNRLSTRRSPIQKFRWVHFPRNAELSGEFVYRVTPVFMNEHDELSYGEYQEAAIELRRETYPGQLNVAFTRGFVASQAFVDKYQDAGPISTLLPSKADEGLDFVPTHPKAKEALDWMGFEARRAILELLDEAIMDTEAQVRVVAYDLSEPDVVSRLVQLGARLKIIIDDDGPHAKDESGETRSAERLAASGAEVKRQHMGSLQHNKTIAVSGPRVQAALCGSTNYTWRGFFVQSNNAVILRGESAVRPFLTAFDHYWTHDDVQGFGRTESARWNDLGLVGIDAHVGFSPYAKENALLETIAKDIGENTTSSLFFSLAFLAQTPGAVQNAIEKVINSEGLFAYGIADRDVGGIELLKPDGNPRPAFPTALGKDAPEPFRSEPTGGGGNRMHHKFVVIDFDQPTARVYLGSYNFSVAADRKNGENLLLIRDRRVAVSYVVEALRIFDHYHFRVAREEAREKNRRLALARPPRTVGEEPWWAEHYTQPRKIRDRELFA